MKILLDTCAFLWLAADAPELSETAKSLFQDTGNAVYLSSVSAWEIIVKNRLGKLPLPAASYREFAARRQGCFSIEPPAKSPSRSF